MAVYLLHLATPLGHARHYIGFSQNVEERLRRHRSDRGARFTQVCNQRGIAYSVARVWPNAARGFESRLKRQKNSAVFCPLCSGERAAHRMEHER